MKNKHSLSKILLDILIVAIPVILTNYDKFKEGLSQATGDLSSILAGLYQGGINALFAPVMLPSVIFWIMLIILFRQLRNYLAKFISTLDSHKEEPRKIEVYRGLEFYMSKNSQGVYEIDNKYIKQAVCAECGGRIISTDSSARKLYHEDIPVNEPNCFYLLCENGHYAGNTIAYDEFLKWRDNPSLNKFGEPNPIMYHGGMQLYKEISSELLNKVNREVIREKYRNS